MSIIKEVGLPKRPPQGRSDEGQDLSERVPPPRSSSPVIGSPPVRAVPIGTPPKQPMSHALNHQVKRKSIFSSMLHTNSEGESGVMENYSLMYISGSNSVCRSDCLKSNCERHHNHNVLSGLLVVILPDLVVI